MTQTKAFPTVTVPSTHKKRRVHSREWPRRPRTDPHTRLIAQLLDLAGPDSSVIATSSHPWASATFVGARHTIILALKGNDHAQRAKNLSQTLPEAEFSIAGHIVADTCIDDIGIGAAEEDIDAHDAKEEAPTADTPPSEEQSSQTIVRLSVLTIEDW